MTEVEGLTKLTDELYKYMPTEIICNDALMMSGIDTKLTLKKSSENGNLSPRTVVF